MAENSATAEERKAELDRLQKLAKTGFDNGEFNSQGTLRAWMYQAKKKSLDSQTAKNLWRRFETLRKHAGLETVGSEKEETQRPVVRAKPEKAAYDEGPQRQRASYGQ